MNKLILITGLFLFVNNIFAIDGEYCYDFGISFSGGYIKNSNYSFQTSLKYEIMGRIAGQVEGIYLNKDNSSYYGGEISINTLGLVLWFNLGVGYLYNNKKSDLTYSGTFYLPIILTKTKNIQYPFTPYYKIRYFNGILHEFGFIFGVSNIKKK